MTKKIALFPGTFDPITLGHRALIERGSAMFDEVIVAVMTNEQKQTLFTAEERVALIQATVADLPNVRVIMQAQDLTVRVAQTYAAQFLLRGLRNSVDFTYEAQMYVMNQQLAPHIETVFLMTSAEQAHISSTLAREIAKYHGDLTTLVTPNVATALREKVGSDE